jgi:DUF1009 family protein
MTESAASLPPIVGVLAGRGVYPTLLIERLLDRDRQVVVAGIRGQYCGRAPVGTGPVETIPLGAIGALGRFFGANGARTVFLAGGVRRRGAWRSARPDLRGLALVPRALVGGDDGLLRAVARELEHAGVLVGDPRLLLEDLFAAKGLIAGPAPSPAIASEMDLAWGEATRSADGTLGQAVVVFQGRIAGREGRDGTDALLARAPGPGAVLAKAVKPGQDRRFDMPAIGPSTVIAAAAVGVRAIAVEAGGVLLLRKQRVLELCEERGVSLVGLSA